MLWNQRQEQLIGAGFDRFEFLSEVEKIVAVIVPDDFSEVAVYGDAAFDRLGFGLFKDEFEEARFHGALINLR